MKKARISPGAGPFRVQCWRQLNGVSCEVLHATKDLIGSYCQSDNGVVSATLPT